MTVLALVPARGGSKGIPMKNLKSIYGKPLFLWTVEQSRMSKEIDITVVSSDYRYILSQAVDAGARIHRRSFDSSTDKAPIESVVAEVLQSYSADIIVILQPTSPARLIQDIEMCIRAVRDEGYDSALSVVPNHRFVWAYNYENDEGISPINYDVQKRPNRQDMDNQFMETGGIYVFRVSGFLEHGSRLFGKIHHQVVDYWTQFEIDTEDDFEMMEWILKNKFPLVSTVL